MTKPDRVVLIGVAGDSGCGKSTFLRRITDLFGESFVTVICLDDYHSLDRKQRKETGITALDPRANNFDLMYEQIRDIKAGKSIMKPIYNHETGELDPPENVDPNHIVVIEGLHPLFDERVRSQLDFSVYLDIEDDVKAAWKIQRDMSERGHTLDDVMQAINSRKPDFDAFIDPQKAHADVVIRVLTTNLIKDDKDRKVLRVQMIQRDGVEGLDPVHIFDEGSTIDWIPCGRQLACPYPGIRMHYGPDAYYGHSVSILEVDGEFGQLEQVIYIEKHLSATSARHPGEITELLLQHREYPGSNNGTGLFQVLTGVKMRGVYERLTKGLTRVAVAV